MTTTETKTSQTTVADAWRILDKFIKSRPGARPKADAICQQQHDQDLASYHDSTIHADDDKIAFYRSLVSTLLGLQPPTMSTTTPALAATPAAIKEATAQSLFELLCQLIRNAGGDMHKKVAAALRASTGRSVALAVYHNDKGVPDDQKRALYLQYIESVKTKNFAEPAKEKAAPSPEPPKESTNAESTSAVTVVEPSAPVKPHVIIVDCPPPGGWKPEDKVPATPRKPVTPAAAAPADPLTAMIVKLVDERIAAARVTAPSDDQIKGVVKEALNNGAFPADRVQSLVAEQMSKLRESITHDIATLVKTEIRSAFVTILNSLK